VIWRPGRPNVSQIKRLPLTAAGVMVSRAAYRDKVKSFEYLLFGKKLFKDVIVVIMNNKIKVRGSGFIIKKAFNK